MIELLKAILAEVPEVRPYLTGQALKAIEGKSQDSMTRELRDLALNLYRGGGEDYGWSNEFQAAVRDGIEQAINQSWDDNGGDGDLPDYLNHAIDDLVMQQSGFISKLYRDIIAGRDGSLSQAQLLSRVDLWAQQYTGAYNQAQELIAQNEPVDQPVDENGMPLGLIAAGLLMGAGAAGGKKLQWVMGATEEHCTTCADLTGIVAYAAEWALLGVHPQRPPNGKLVCGGWRCDCALVETDEPRSDNALDEIRKAIA